MASPMGKEFRNLKGHAFVREWEGRGKREKKEESWRGKEGVMGRS